MIDMKNEQWLREKYEEVCGKNPEEYALISLKIKRFRIFNRLFGREAGDRLVEKVYTAIIRNMELSLSYITQILMRQHLCLI